MVRSIIGALWLPVGIAAAGACGELGFIAEVTGRRAFQPPAEYRQWWAANQQCSGRAADFERIRWYLADGISGDGVAARGRWTAPHDIIIVAGYEEDEKTVRHEMLHDLLNGDPAHVRVEWDGCGLRFETTSP